MSPPVKHQGPSPSERALIQLWDTIDQERLQRGERAASELARKALAAVEPPKKEQTRG